MMKQGDEYAGEVVERRMQRETKAGGRVDEEFSLYSTHPDLNAKE